MATRAGVRRLLAHLWSVSPSSVRFTNAPCPACRISAHGPPLAGSTEAGVALPISVSRTHGLAALALAGETRLGIDVEARPTPADQESEPNSARWQRISAALRLACTPEEEATIHATASIADRLALYDRCWTRKEAVVKAMGLGLAWDLRSLPVRPLEPGPLHITVPERPPHLWLVHDLPWPPGRNGTAALAVPAVITPWTGTSG
ncbi:4'-phosphopantetheinyl transferase superfamily protein [Streptomyces sp. NPDC004539]|uniref:4'-phosphopantetheinyl transferase family protein n=1 Tax=Streptomyces sp. NPDC004539 TaxID=3154280 RepID=UPI0033B9911A